MRCTVVGSGYTLPGPQVISETNQNIRIDTITLWVVLGLHIKIEIEFVASISLLLLLTVMTWSLKHASRVKQTPKVPYNQVKLSGNYISSIYQHGFPSNNN